MHTWWRGEGYHRDEIQTPSCLCVCLCVLGWEGSRVDSEIQGGGGALLASVICKEETMLIGALLACVAGPEPKLFEIISTPPIKERCG